MKFYVALKKTEKKILSSIIGAIILSIVSSFIYENFFSNDNSKITIKQDTIIKKLDESNNKINSYENVSKEILSTIKQLAKEQKRKIQNLMDENKKLKYKIKKLSFENKYPILQDKIIKLISEYKYPDAIRIITNFIKENKSIDNKELSKMYYQMALFYFAQRNIKEAKKNIETSFKYDKNNVIILDEYNNLLKYIIEQKNKNNITRKSIDKNTENFFDFYLDNKNILYRGIENRLLLINNNKIKSIKVVNKNIYLKKLGKNLYSIDVSNYKSNKINLIIKVTFINGKEYTKQKTFNIINFPSPIALIDGKSGYVKIPKNSLLNKTINVVVPFFNLPLKVTSFKIKLPNKTIIKINSNKLNSYEFNKFIKHLKRGDILYIMDIRAQLKNNKEYYLKKTFNLVVEIM